MELGDADGHDRYGMLDAAATAWCATNAAERSPTSACTLGEVTA